MAHVCAHALNQRGQRQRGNKREKGRRPWGRQRRERAAVRMREKPQHLSETPQHVTTSLRDTATRDLALKETPSEPPLEESRPKKDGLGFRV